MFPRSWADSWLKLPEISALALSVWRTEGAETTSPSRTIANRFWGSACCDSLPVIDWNFLDPASVKSMVTIHMPRCWSKAPLASSTSRPSTSAGPRRYFDQTPGASSPQATVDWSGLTPWPAAVRCLGSRQFRAVNFCSSAAAAGSGVGVACGVPVAFGVAEDEGEALPEGVGLGALRASVSARPWVEAVADGVAEDFSPAVGAEEEAEGFGEAEPEGVAVGASWGAPFATARTGRK